MYYSSFISSEKQKYVIICILKKKNAGHILDTFKNDAHTQTQNRNIMKYLIFPNSKCQKLPCTIIL